MANQAFESQREARLPISPSSQLSYKISRRNHLRITKTLIQLRSNDLVRQFELGDFLQYFSAVLSHVSILAKIEKKLAFDISSLCTRFVKERSMQSMHIIHEHTWSVLRSNTSILCKTTVKVDVAKLLHVGSEWQRYWVANIDFDVSSID